MFEMKNYRVVKDYQNSSREGIQNSGLINLYLLLIS